VADLRVAHILIAGQTDGGAVGLQPGVGAGGEQVVQGGGVGQLDGIAAATVALTDAVHDYENNGFLHCKYLQKILMPNAWGVKCAFFHFYYFTLFLSRIQLFFQDFPEQTKTDGSEPAIWALLQNVTFSFVQNVKSIAPSCPYASSESRFASVSPGWV
jgi:hypothetical protein